MDRSFVRPLVMTSLLFVGGCIPNQAAPIRDHNRPPAAAPSYSTPYSETRVIEAEPVWAAQQVTPNAQTVVGTTYIVQSGDTLRGIGNRTGAGSEIIAKTNNLAPPYIIHAGQKLIIPAGRYHLVAEGETGIAIAAAYGIAWSQVVAINGLTEPYALRKGQRLLLPDSALQRPPSLEERASAFRIDIDDVLTGGQPASAPDTPKRAASAAPRPLPSNMPAATPDSFSGNFAWPVNGTLLARFGQGASGTKNNGIDIAVEEGTPVKAAANGVVAYAGDKVAIFGGLVLINHGSGWVSVYGHLSRIDLVRGQKITKGQVIGLSGDSGYASAPKLHFELRKDRVPVNPLPQLPAR